MKKIAVIACEVLRRELYYLAHDNENIIDVILMPQGLHDEPKKLYSLVQETIERVENEDRGYDAICLGYGLCSNGIVGLCTEKTPLIIPRANDCISLLLGSRHKYDELFKKYSGIYWYSSGWIEHPNEPMPGPDRMEKIRKKYLEMFDEDTAEVLMETELGWMERYGYAIFVDWPQLKNDKHKEYTKMCAEYLNWQYLCQPGKDTLLRDMLSGNWSEEDFLILPPGKSPNPSYDDYVIKSE